MKSIRIPIPKFTQSRVLRRWNMVDYDRSQFFYWNLLSIGLTIIPIGYLFSANYRVTDISQDSVRTELPKKSFNPRLFGLYDKFE